ncbi:hypothetical protein [Gordonia alkaliphila]|uniref:Uncharacterized protein n=1 Tax=Gordonia alkaliphila TaxID=1053547 RepID=A0ABP8Z4T7_9ACTN
MVDETRWARERSAWVVARAGRSPAANRRGERLASRARKAARYEAGTGDAPVAEVYTRPRVMRGLTENEERPILRGLGTLLYEAGRLVIAGPGIALSWVVYGLWWKNVPAWGPLRWDRLLFAAMTLTGALILAWWIIVPDTTTSKFWLFYFMAQLVIGVGRASWLTWAYGWAAAPAGVRAGAVAPIRVMTGTEPPLPTTEPTEPVGSQSVPIRAVRIPVQPNDIEEN